MLAPCRPVADSRRSRWRAWAGNVAALGVVHPAGLVLHAEAELVGLTGGPDGGGAALLLTEAGELYAAELRMAD